MSKNKKLSLPELTHALRSLYEKKEEIRHSERPSVVYFPDYLEEEERDHVIAPSDVLIARGDVGKLEGNLNAIILAKALREEDRLPTSDEKKVLAQFVGWGGLARYLDMPPYLASTAQAFFGSEANTDKWRANTFEPYSFVGKTYQKCANDLWDYLDDYFSNATQRMDKDDLRKLVLWGLLSNTERYDAVGSTINAHYTDRDIIVRMWELARAFGFEGGNVLESSAGVGHFFGLMPEDMRQHSRLFGIEKDALTGQILALLYPQADIRVMGFEEANDLPFGKFDLVIGNVPFGGKKLAHDAVFTDLNAFNLHNYFLAKNLICLRPGGIALLITSMSTMDNGVEANSLRITSRDFRLWATSPAGGNSELIGAIRLPNNAFAGNAKTEVTTDILIFRKRPEGHAATNLAQDFHDVYAIRQGIYTPEKSDLDKDDKPKAGTPTHIDVGVNEYYLKNPAQMIGEMLLGSESKRGALYTGNATTCELKDASQYLPLLDKACHNLAHALKGCYTHVLESVNVGGEWEPLGTYVIYEEKGYVVEMGEFGAWSRELIELQFDKRFTLQMLKGYLGVRDALKALVEYDSQHEETNSSARAALNKVYDAFVAKHGYINQQQRYFKDEASWYLLASLEEMDPQTGDYVKADIFTKKIITAETDPTHAANLYEAVLLCDSYKGGIHLAYIASLLGISPEEAETQLLTKEWDIAIEGKKVSRPLAFRNPQTGDLEIHEQYLSGNVRQKLVIARAVAENNPDFAINVRHLEANQPPYLTLDKIIFNLGSTWIPTEIVEAFAVQYLWLQVRVHRHMDADTLRYDVAVLKGKNNDKHNAKNISVGVYYHGNKRQSEYRLPNGKKILVPQPDILNKLGHDVLEIALMQNTPIIQRYKVDDAGNVMYNTRPDGSRAYLMEVDEQLTSDLMDKVQNMHVEFVSFVARNKDYIQQLETIYNERLNAYIPRVWSEPVFDYFPNASHEKKPRSYQKRAVKRALTESTGLFHDVGTGKSMTLQTIAMEARRLGIARKTMIVVQNATYEQFVASFYQLYPQAKILAFNHMEVERLPSKKQKKSKDKNKTTAGLAGEDTRAYDISKAKSTRKKRIRLFGRIATGDFDAIIVPQSVFAMIPDSPARLKALHQEQTNALRALIESLIDKDDKSQDGFVKKLQALKRSQDTKLEEIEEQIEQEDELDEEEETSGGKKKSAKDQARAQSSGYTDLLMRAQRRVDNIAYFENLGIDMLLIDEFHAYKRFGFTTTKEKVKGIDTAGSSRSLSTMLKIRYIFEKYGERNVVGATGTPISNTVAEMWTMMKYLRPSLLEATRSQSFDAFCNNFALVLNSFEMDAGGRYNSVARLAKYQNMPELLQIWFAFADVVGKDILGKSKELTDMQYIEQHATNYRNQTPLLATQPNGKRGITSIIVPQSDAQAKQVRIFRRILDFFQNMTPMLKREYSYIPLLVYGMANRATVDLRLLPPTLSNKLDRLDRDDTDLFAMNRMNDAGNSKLDYCVENAYRLYLHGDEDGETALQMIFCDRYRLVIEDYSQFDANGAPVQVEAFNVYAELKRKLIEKGVPAHEIVLMTDINTDKKREDAFERAVAGEIAFLIGSTEKMGVGVNVQNRLLALHHIDAPVRPMDFAQRNGRIIRQGNRNPVVQIFTYGIEKTLDAVSYGRLEVKQKFIHQVMSGSLTERSIEDELDDEQGSFFESLSVMLTGSTTALDLMNARKEQRDLQNKIRNAHATLIQNQSALSSANTLIEHHREKLKVAEMFQQAVEQDNQKRGNQEFTISELADEQGVIWDTNSTQPVETEKTVKEKGGTTRTEKIIKQEPIPLQDGLKVLLDKVLQTGKGNGRIHRTAYINGFELSISVYVTHWGEGENKNYVWNSSISSLRIANAKGGQEDASTYFQDAHKFGIHDDDLRNPPRFQSAIHKYFRAIDKIVDFYAKSIKQKQEEVEYITKLLEKNDIAKLSQQLTPLSQKISDLEQQLKEESALSGVTLRGLNGLLGGVGEAFSGLSIFAGLYVPSSAKIMGGLGDVETASVFYEDLEEGMVIPAPRKLGNAVEKGEDVLVAEIDYKRKAVKLSFSDSIATKGGHLPIWGNQWVSLHLFPHRSGKLSLANLTRQLDRLVMEVQGSKSLATSALPIPKNKPFQVRVEREMQGYREGEIFTAQYSPPRKKNTGSFVIRNSPTANLRAEVSESIAIFYLEHGYWGMV